MFILNEKKKITSCQWLVKSSLYYLYFILQWNHLVILVMRDLAEMAWVTSVRVKIYVNTTSTTLTTSTASVAQYWWRHELNIPCMRRSLIYPGPGGCWLSCGWLWRSRGGGSPEFVFKGFVVLVLVVFLSFLLSQRFQDINGRDRFQFSCPALSRNGRIYTENMLFF